MARTIKICIVISRCCENKKQITNYPQCYVTSLTSNYRIEIKIKTRYRKCDHCEWSTVNEQEGIYTEGRSVMRFTTVPTLIRGVVAFRTRKT